MLGLQPCCWATVLDFAPHGVVEGHLALGEVGCAIDVQAGEVAKFYAFAAVGAVAVRLFEQAAGPFAKLAFLRLCVPDANQQN